jgi:hypothetical protein
MVVFAPVLSFSKTTLNSVVSCASSSSETSSAISCAEEISNWGEDGGLTEG